MATRRFDDEDIKQIVRWFQGNQESASERMVSELEEAFAEKLGAQFAIAVGCAMDGLQLALQARGVGPGDEVVVDPIVSFGGLAVMYVGGIPVFADIDRDTYNMTAETLRASVTTRTKAVICTHFAGTPCEMDEIMAVARKRGLVVVEDCAHALLARYKGRYAGLLGDVGVFSFNHRKPLSTGQGGMMTFTSEALYREVRERLAFGRVPQRLVWNSAMPGIVAAAALAQLGKCDDYIREDHGHAEQMNHAVAGCPWLMAQRVPPHSWSAGHLWAATFYGERYGVDMETFRRTCVEEGADYLLFGFMPPVEGQPKGAPAYVYPVFTEYRRRLGDSTAAAGPEPPCPNAEEICQRMVNTTLSPLPRHRVDRQIEGLSRAVRRFR